MINFKTFLNSSYDIFINPNQIVKIEAKEVNCYSDYLKYKCIECKITLSNNEIISVTIEKEEYEELKRVIIGNNE